MNRLITLIQTMLSLCWNFFRLKFPGTNVTFGALLFLPMIVMIAVAFFRHMFGVGGFGSVSKGANSISRRKN